MSNTLTNGEGFDLSIPPGNSLTVVAVSGSYTASIVDGVGKGTALATNGTGGTYGPYTSGAVIRLISSALSEVDYDIGVSPVIVSDTHVMAQTNPLTGRISLLAGSTDISAAILGAMPSAYIAASSGAPYISANGLSVVIPACVGASNGMLTVNADTTLTPPLPSRTICTVTSGSVAYPEVMQLLGKQNWHVENGSAGPVSGNINVNGMDERGYWLADTITIAAVGASGASDTVSNKYFSIITSVTVSGTLGNAGVVITGTEYQFRTYVKTSSGIPVFSTNNTYTSNESKVATLEVRAAGVYRVQDFRQIGPIAKSQRIGSEIVDFSGGTSEGPQNWLGNCIYAAEELMDGNIIIGGNGALCSIFDGQTWGAAFKPTGLSTGDSISAILCIGRDATTAEAEVVYFGTFTGKCIRWNRTANTYATVTLGGSWSTNGVNKLLQTTAQNYVIALGDGGKVNVIQDNGASASTVYDHSALFGAGSNNIKSGAYQDGYVVGVGGGSSGMHFRIYTMSGLSVDLSAYLPGSASQKGSTTGTLYGVASTGDGRLLLVGLGSTGYFAEWNLRQTYARGLATFTVGAAVNIPAGFKIGDGTRQFVTKIPASSSGAGSITVEIEATTEGYAGMASVSTVTTLIDTLANVSAVSNPEPIGMGRFVGHGGYMQQPRALISVQPMAAAWTGRIFVIPMQGGDVLTFDGARLRNQLGALEFKGRATGALVSTKSTWLFGDEGKLFSMPN